MAAALALAAATALALTPLTALAAGYTLDVSAAGGTLRGVSAIDSAGGTVSGSVYSGDTYVITEPSPGPFTLVGTGTNGAGTTAGAVYFGASVSQATYSGTATLSLPSAPPASVRAPAGIALTAGAAAQTVAISVYSATYGAVSDGSLLVLSPSAGLTLTASGAHEAQVGQSVYAGTVSGVVYAQLAAGAAGSYTLTVDSPPGSTLAGGTIPVAVAACGTCGGSSGATPPGASSGTTSGGSASADGVSGTLVLSTSFPAGSAETLTSSDGAVTLNIPAGAIAPSGTVTLQVIEFGAAATAQLLPPGGLPAGEHPLGLSFDFSATVNGSPVHTFAAPITADYSLAALQGQVTTAAQVDLMRIDAGETLTYIGGQWTGSVLQVQMAGFTPYALVEVDHAFSDVQGNWAESDIELMASKFVVQGYPDGSFRPDGAVTRAEFTAMLLRLIGIPVDANAADTFADVAPGAWYAPAVATAAEKGIVLGYSATSFGPNDSLTREQLVAILVRAAQLQGWVNPAQAATGTTTLQQTFTDVSQLDSWAQADVAIAVANGLVRGRTATTLVPLGTTTRAEAATWVARLFTKFL